MVRAREKTSSEDEEAMPIIPSVGSAGQPVNSCATLAIKTCAWTTFPCATLLGAALLAIQKYISNMAVEQMVTIDESQVRDGCESGLDLANMTYNLWWPGCGYVTEQGQVNDECALPCFSPTLLQEMDTFNKAHPGKKVTYMSRSSPDIEDVQLTGWWLPAPSANEYTPRIMLQHGFKENSNMFRQQLMAYLLRSVGFSVLVNNVRDHGYSANSSTHVVEWGHSYHYDTLGAWDYAVSDPDGHLGGAVEPAMVGLMGFSKGAFTVMNALGNEGGVPGAWLDSGPSQPKVVFANGAARVMQDLGLGLLAPMMINGAWRTVVHEASVKGADLAIHIPATELPRGPQTARPVYVVGNEQDGTVPIEETLAVAELFRQMPEQYDLKGVWISKDTDCHGSTHCIDHLANSGEYTQRVCEFWVGVFGTHASDAGINCPTTHD